MIRLLLLIALSFTFYSCASKRSAPLTAIGSYAAPHNISDMVLIYDGGAHRDRWDEERFRPYVYAQHKNDEKGDWLFDGFLFLEIFDSDRVGFASGYRPFSAKKEDWLKLLDHYFEKEMGLNALDQCIENAKKICGKLPFKRKIVMSLPEPISQQKDWGSINGVALDFSKDEDRIKASEWFIDRIVERFKKEQLSNIELEGFYWLAEEATNTRTFVKNISEYLKRGHQYSFYWIPYFKSDGYDTWETLGFDRAYLQPNHFFDTNIPDSRIDETCFIAKQYNMSLEMEFDERIVENDAMRARLFAYIDGFKRNDVFKQTDIAYYVGSDGMNILWNGDKKDVELYYNLTDIIVKRQRSRELRNK
ncbi:DUF4855 domain-containing protein [Sphingobacterium sp. UT-1RO-CII-1]|uniref:DUF4855 domain-containing protein n=1 Tax=Sphingobacterium sp. UT-1RO-CII-1 TaxID=2995225 RepID=UPI00227A284B|nr:DUF4855 domain-containing protein [Sphingobacterium sp. UT-1RO-CII-1]MCY4779148.1 DUF4855 domain-containing protein [Sphingobacterium sp. UT-1RO-CII-1]